MTGPAHLAFVNGVVHTVDRRRTRARAVAVRAGRIVAVGDDADIRDLVDGSTEVVDLRGRMLLPGFQDAHVHPPGGGLEMLRCDLNPGATREDYAWIVRDYARGHPDAAWIVGGGWSMSAFPNGTPTRDVLDAVVADRPTYLPNRDGHSAWVNSRALELAGVTAGTPDPHDGRIERDADGVPTGALHEGAMRLVEDLIPPTTAREWEEGLLAGQEHLHALGITAWQDAIVGGGYDTLDAYLAVADRGELTARVVGALWWDRNRGAEQIEGLVAARERSERDRFRASAVKIMQDGVVETFTAAVLEPYLDEHGRPTDRRGLSFVDPEALRDDVRLLDAAGFQVHVHAIGDRAVRESLDALEAARAANGPNDLRHHIAHLQIVHPDDLPRFAMLGVVANAQPLWASYEAQMADLTVPFLGPERATWQYPFGSLVRSGARLAFGSDWSVSSANPLEEIHVAVNRRLWEEEAAQAGRRAVEEIFLPEERIDLETAVEAFTMGSAYVNHLDDVAGSIEIGKAADLVVLDRDLFEHPIDEVHAARVHATYVEGLRVSAAPDAPD
ncbi:MAG TPA: amidohydrolase [Actinomycetota bacterium]